MADAKKKESKWFEDIAPHGLLFLLVHSGSLSKFQEYFRARRGNWLVEAYEVLATFLCHEVEKRLRADFGWSYRHSRFDSRRARGRIDLRRTESHALLEQGKVACRHDELILDTARNRLVRAALACLTRLLGSSEQVARCRRLESQMLRYGIGKRRPTEAELAADPVGRDNRDDAMVLGVARAVFSLPLPDATVEHCKFPNSLKDPRAFGPFYENAIRNFYTKRLSNSPEWKAPRIAEARWKHDRVTDRRQRKGRLPKMKMDLVIESKDGKGCLIIDMKAKNGGAVKDNSFRYDDMYQMYAYLDFHGTKARSVEGILLYLVLLTKDEVDSRVDFGWDIGWEKNPRFVSLRFVALAFNRSVKDLEKCLLEIPKEFSERARAQSDPEE